MELQRGSRRADGGNVAEEGVCTLAEEPSLQDGAVPPRPSLHTRLGCKRQLMGHPAYPGPAARTKGLAVCAILGSPVLSRTGGWDAAPQGLLPGGRREPGTTPAGYCHPIPGGTRLVDPHGPAVRPTASLPDGCVSPKSLLQVQCLLHSMDIVPTWLGGLSAPRKELARRQLLAAEGLGHRPRVHPVLGNWHLQVIWDQEEVSPRGQSGHNWDAGGLDAEMLLPPCSF